MGNDAKLWKALIDHLEAARRLTERLHDPDTGYFVDKALEQVVTEGVSEVGLIETVADQLSTDQVLNREPK